VYMVHAFRSLPICRWRAATASVTPRADARSDISFDASSDCPYQSNALSNDAVAIESSASIRVSSATRSFRPIWRSRSNASKSACRAPRECPERRAAVPHRAVHRRGAVQASVPCCNRRMRGAYTSGEARELFVKGRMSMFSSAAKSPEHALRVICDHGIHFPPAGSGKMVAGLDPIDRYRNARTMRRAYITLPELVRLQMKALARARPASPPRNTTGPARACRASGMDRRINSAKPSEKPVVER